MKRMVVERTYIDLSLASRPPWASGCDRCRFGLIDPPPADVAAASTYLIRTYQASNGRLTFCDCQAGQAYKRFLRGRYADLRDGKDAVSSDMAEALTEAVTTPSVRYEKVPA